VTKDERPRTEEHERGIHARPYCRCGNQPDDEQSDRHGQRPHDPHQREQPAVVRRESNMKQFDTPAFQSCLGNPTLESTRSWGVERRYCLTPDRLHACREQLADTLYAHHSSFDYADEIAQLGFAQTASALRQYRSGLPDLHTTRMAHLAEVMGVEYGRLICDFRTTPVYPKRFNPNPDQAMKGADVIGISCTASNVALLLGEAKCYRKFDRSSVEESYRHLASMYEQDIRKLLAFWKEALRFQRQGSYGTADATVACLDRLYFSQSKVNHSFLALIINEDSPRDPFRAFDQLATANPLPGLLAVHIQIPNLADILPTVFEARS
jgi:hypothetical protein